MSDHATFQLKFNAKKQKQKNYQTEYLDYNASWVYTSFTFPTSFSCEANALNLLNNLSLILCCYTA